MVVALSEAGDECQHRGDFVLVKCLGPFFERSHDDYGPVLQDRAVTHFRERGASVTGSTGAYVCSILLPLMPL